jgi:DNA-binding SARP family transcriptional activator
MEFRVLGSIEVIENGRRLTVASGRQLALLAARHPRDRVVSTEQIIDERG